ncbi:glycosyltransferase [Gemmatimonadota bacterium]
MTIPAIARFPWVGGPMSWLRRRTIETFRAHNPDWQVEVVQIPQHIQRTPGLSPAHMSDWARYLILRDEGGFVLDTDIVFTAPVPDPWLDSEICVCTNGEPRVYQMAMMGAAPGAPFFEACAANAAFLAGEQGEYDYQEFGVLLMARVAATVVAGLSWPAMVEGLYDQPMDALCHVRWDDVDVLWDGPDVRMPPETIGVHWYGGHPRSRTIEMMSRIEQPDCFLVRLADDTRPGTRGG